MKIDVKKFSDQFIYEISDSNYFSYANIQLMLVLLEVFPQYIFKAEIAGRFTQQFQLDVINYLKEVDPDYLTFTEDDEREYDEHSGEPNSFWRTVTIASKKLGTLLQIHARGNILLMSGTEENAKSLVDLIRSKSNYKEKKPHTINFIYRGNHGFQIREIEIKNKTSYAPEYYNTDFVAVNDRINVAINTPHQKGLILLHGEMGTGKTSYIKHLITTAPKPVYYIPPDLATELASPAFINFIVSKLANSILIIEDAENVLKERESGSHQAVSNILNLSDGILGDAVSSLIICTFNCPIAHIDQALLRKGRLITSYDFKKLTPEKTAELYQQLHGIDRVGEISQTLADVFNYNNGPVTNEKEKVKLGFV